MKSRVAVANAVALIQARMGSHRFPGKSLAPLGGLSMLGMLLIRLEASRELDSIVVATSTEKIDDPIEAETTRLGLTCFRGPDEDVLTRFVMTARQYPARLYVRICADNPFTDPGQVDRLVQFATEGHYDLAYNHRKECGLPDGVGAEVLTAEALNRLDALATAPSHREHVTLYAYQNEENFCLGLLQARPECRRPDIRLDVDYPEDLEFLNQMCLELPLQSSPLWSTLDIISTLDRLPALSEHRRQRVGPR